MQYLSAVEPDLNYTLSAPWMQADSESTMSSPLLEEKTNPAGDAAAELADDVLYADESKTLRHRNRVVMLYLNTTHVLIHDVKSLKKNIDLDLHDIIGCTATADKNKPLCYLKIFAYPKISSCCSGGPKRVPRTYSIVFENQAVALNWNNAVHCACRGLPLSFVAGDTNHTVMAPAKRKYLCVVNPFSGKVRIVYCFVV